MSNYNVEWKSDIYVVVSPMTVQASYQKLIISGTYVGTRRHCRKLCDGLF